MRRFLLLTIGLLLAALLGGCSYPYYGPYDGYAGGPGYYPGTWPYVYDAFPYRHHVVPYGYSSFSHRHFVPPRSVDFHRGLHRKHHRTDSWSAHRHLPRPERSLHQRAPATGYRNKLLQAHEHLNARSQGTLDRQIRSGGRRHAGEHSRGSQGLTGNGLQCRGRRC